MNSGNTDSCGLLNSVNATPIMSQDKLAGVPISEAEARIVAHVCGDGCLSTYQGKRYQGPKDHHRNKLSRTEYVIIYCNTEPSLLQSFTKDVKKVYGRATCRNGNIACSFRAKWVFNRIKRFGGGKSKEWFIAEEILNAEKPIIKEWLKAFFDDEAYVELRSSSISVNSVNFNGLKQIKWLLEKFGIPETTLKGPYYYKNHEIFRLTVLSTAIDKYMTFIGFYHPKKIRTLEKIRLKRENQVALRRPCYKRIIFKDSISKLDY